MLINACHINITSIKKHKDELLARFSQHDIISINETNLRKENHFFIKGYNIFRNDRVEKTGGGVLLAIKDHIKCQELFNKTIDGNEILAVEIETTSFKSILIASIYIPPKVKLNNNVFHELYNINNNCIIMGDLNAALQQMGSRKTNAKGRQLQDLLNEGFLNCIDDDMTTFEKNDYEEKIDWILGSQPLISFITNVETHPPIGTFSGHKPLTFDISIGAEPKPTSPRISLNFKAAKWATFRRKLDEHLRLWDNTRMLNSTLDIEDYASFITDSITSATQDAIPTTKLINSSYVPSEATKRLIKLKHQAYRRWKKNEDDLEKKLYYNNKVLLTNSLRNDRKYNFNKLMSSLCQKKMYSASVWFTVRKFHNKRVKQTYPNSMKYNNTTATSNKEKADLFAEYFQNEVYVQSPDILPFHEQVTKQTLTIKNKINNIYNRNKWKEITTKEVEWNIKQLKNSSTGPDNVHNRCLKNHTKLLVHHLTNLFNLVVNLGYIPNTWKKANIILLLKPKKDKQLPSSYRPISLLSCTGKLLEKIIKQRLMVELERRKILPEHQAGFRPGKSTLYNIVRLERYAQNQLSQRRHAAVILFDIKAAFDSVWHDGLIYKLYNLRLPQYLINYFISFLENRTAEIELENILSYPFTLNSGTPQGSPLSPLLYIIYTSDSMNGIPNHTEHGLFADDTALWTGSNSTSSVRSRLQQSIDEFVRWCKAWKLKLQPTKTEFIHFSPHPRKKYKNPVSIEVEGTFIKSQAATRYLGVIIDKTLNWRCHLHDMENKIADRISLLRFLSRSASDPNDTIMLNIYKALVRTIITYGYPVLLTANNKTWERLQILQNKAIRAALNLPFYTSVEYIHKISNIPKIKQYALALMNKAIAKSKSNNGTTLTKHLTDILRQM